MVSRAPNSRRRQLLLSAVLFLPFGLLAGAIVFLDGRSSGTAVDDAAVSAQNGATSEGETQSRAPEHPKGGAAAERRSGPDGKVSVLALNVGNESALLRSLETEKPRVESRMRAPEPVFLGPITDRNDGTIIDTKRVYPPRDTLKGTGQVMESDLGSDGDDAEPAGRRLAAGAGSLTDGADRGLLESDGEGRGLAAGDYGQNTGSDRGMLAAESAATPDEIYDRETQSVSDNTEGRSAAAGDGDQNEGSDEATALASRDTDETGPDPDATSRRATRPAERRRETASIRPETEIDDPAILAEAAPPTPEPAGFARMTAETREGEAGTLRPAAREMAVRRRANAETEPDAEVSPGAEPVFSQMASLPRTDPSTSTPSEAASQAEIPQALPAGAAPSLPSQVAITDKVVPVTADEAAAIVVPNADGAEMAYSIARPGVDVVRGPELASLDVPAIVGPQAGTLAPGSGAITVAPPPPPPSPAEFIVPGAPWLVQLIAVEDEVVLCEYWSDLKAKHPELFGEAERTVARKVMSDGRIVFRLRAGAFRTREHAADYCEAIGKFGQACYPVARGS